MQIIKKIAIYYVALLHKDRGLDRKGKIKHQVPGPALLPVQEQYPCGYLDHLYEDIPKMYQLINGECFVD